jgi:hypothetical protein
MSMSTEHAAWLLPREDQLLALRNWVRELAPRHEGHLFEPHVTLQVDLPFALDAAAALVDGLAAATPVLHWPVHAVEGTEHYFRSLYLRLGGGEAFERLCGLCVQACGSEAGLSPYAHLSLAYGPTRGDALALRAALMQRWGAQPLVLDRIALARAGSALPIEAWGLVHVQALRGTQA